MTKPHVIDSASVLPPAAGARGCVPGGGRLAVAALVVMVALPAPARAQAPVPAFSETQDLPLDLALRVPESQPTSAPAATVPAPPPPPVAAPAVDSRELDDLKERVTLLEAEQERRQASRLGRALRLYGFTDVVFSKWWVKEGSLWEGFGTEKSTFNLWSINLYLDKQLSDSFRFLSEVRFMAAPTGTQTMQGNRFVFHNTTFMEPNSGAYARWGTVSIERAQVEYKLADYFQVVAGRFLTPYGIWNEDHGSPVLIPTRQPMPVYNQVVPKAQSGLYLKGRVFPLTNLFLDYGITVSNGRGPLDEVRDLDENKGLGLRVRGLWEGAFTLGLGSYLYTGDYTYAEKVITDFSSMGGVVDKSIWYREQMIALDFLMEVAGLRLQAELMRSAIEYKDQKRETNFGGRLVLPDHVDQGWYVLVAYRLPLEGLELRPYGMIEYLDQRQSPGYTYTGGINWRITPAVVLKGEYYYAAPEGTQGEAFSPWHAFGAQLAVAF